MKNKLNDVCIVGGLGHVGLPLGISLARSGKRVMLYDIDEKARHTVSQGKMPLHLDLSCRILYNPIRSC